MNPSTSGKTTNAIPIVTTTTAAASASSSSNDTISSSSSSSTNTSGLGSYEATMAALSIYQQPDPIYWMNDVTYRDTKYRYLHHQNGYIGIYTIRLLQAKNLQRNYWSPLAIGPMKLLRLSNAYGPVSSYCEFNIQYIHPHDTILPVVDDYSTTRNVSNNSSNSNNSNNDDRKPPAVVRNNHDIHNHSIHPNNNNKPIMKSPVIPNNDHPVWGDTCHFDFPLLKKNNNGASTTNNNIDGMRIVLTVSVYEDAATPIDHIIALPTMNNNNNNNNDTTSGSSTNNNNNNRNHRLLGIGHLDLTELCYGENIITGQPLPGVRDVWIDLSLPRNTDTTYNNNNNNEYYDTTTTTTTTTNTTTMNDSKLPAATKTVASSSLHSSSDNETKKDVLASNSTNDQHSKQGSNEGSSTSSSSSSSYGQVRILVSYQPVGLEPQPKDIVAFESFARHNKLVTSCKPIIDPLLPLTVIDRRGSYLLVEYMIQHHNNHHHHNNTEKACLRVHRNAVFVIERQNIIDAATNLALLPMDVALSTPIGQATKRTLTPFVVAGKEILMPALLSTKLIWMATRTTTLGIASGLLALTGTLWHEGSTSLTGGNNNHDNHSQRNIDNTNSSHYRRQLRHVQDRRSNATAQFVQL